MNYENAKNVYLKHCELVREVTPRGDVYYLHLKYYYENDRGRYILHIPRVCLDILTNKLPNIIHEHPLKPMVTMNGCQYIMDEAGVEMVDLDGNNITPKGACIVQTIEEYSREVTMDEIEKKFGHKVKIVNNKGEN